MRKPVKFLAKLVVIALITSPGGPFMGWRAVAAVQMPPTAKAAPAQPPDGGWPRAYTTPTNAQVILYQPQVGLWPDQKHMTLFAAVSYLAPDAQKPALGTLK